MTENHINRIHRQSSMRKLLCILLPLGILAGGVYVGTALGTAATHSSTDDVIASPAASDATPTSADEGQWYLKNTTGQPVYGTWEEQMGSKISKISRTEKEPLQSGDSVYAPSVDGGFFEGDYWMGHICFNHKQWNFPRQKTIPLGGFTLFGTPKEGLSTQWNDYMSNPHTAHLIENVAEGQC